MTDPEKFEEHMSQQKAKSIEIREQELEEQSNEQTHNTNACYLETTALRSCIFA
jgi:hypothetical protein